MSRDTDKNLFIVSSVPRFYQQLLSGIGSYQELGNRIIRQTETAHAFRQVEHVGDIPTAIYFYNEALKTSPNVSEYVDSVRSIAVLKSAEGFHNSALRDLENLIPLVRYVEPRLYYDFLNSYAIELGEANRKDEARNINKHVVVSPFAPVYPEWQETAQELREPNRAFISVPHVKHKPVETEAKETRHASEPKRFSKVLPFPKLKKAPPPQRPERVTHQEFGDMPLLGDVFS